MQVLRFLTFTLCDSPLPLSASDGEQRSGVCACVENALFIVYENVCARAPVPTVDSAGAAKPCGGLAQETRFDTSMVKITCVQTVIALQTMRTAITHF